MTSHRKTSYLLTALLSAGSFLAHAQYDPKPEFKGTIGRTLKESKQWFPEKLKAPTGAPNVIWILLDDVGFGATHTFGGLIETPNFDKLASNGLRYTNFHTAAICAPTRAGLLTGRNHHAVGMGHHPELGIGAPGYSGDIPFEAGTVAEIFKENGYNTFALGKWHSTHPSQTSPSGPFNRWPTGRGFEHFFGFFGGSTDQWHPLLVEETNQVNIEPNTKHFTELITDKAISYIANQKSADAEKPFFLYFAPGATHAPHQVAKEWINKYKGKFDKGWDAYREETFKQQQALGLLPKGTKLPARQPGVQEWNSLSADEKKVYARFMEVYAAYLSYTDHEIGRLVDYLKEIDQLNNTAIFLIIGDNGGSKEGTYGGTIGSAEGIHGESIPYLLTQLDKIGAEFNASNYPLGWSQAANTPFRYWKSDANSEGGSHNPLIVHYPNGIKEKGGIRTQYGHVIDILPTTLEITGAKVPEVINGYKQMPLHGTSLAYSLNDSKAPTRHTIQYYEIHGGRAIYKDGWKASVYHPRNIFGEGVKVDINFSANDFNHDKWELYNLNEDWNETKDLAAKYPEKLEELKTLFDTEAKKYGVYPLRDYREGVPAPVVKARTVLYGESTSKFKVPLSKKEIEITANIEATSGSEGVIFAAGSYQGGISLYAKDGKLFLTLTDGKSSVVLDGKKSLVAGKQKVQVTISSDGSEGRTITISLNGDKLGSQKLPAKFSALNAIASEGISVAKDLNAPVSESYKGTFPFTGKVQSIVIEQ